MNFFKQSSQQAREAFTAMPMQSRVISVMLVAAIAIGLAFLVRGTNAASTTFLFGGRTFGEQELDAIELAFSKAGLNDWHREGRRIKVPHEAKATYLAALEESSTLPMSLQTNVLEAINSASVFESSDLMEARQQAAKEADLSKRIAMFPDVKSASVVYDRGDRRGLSRTRSQSASVVVVPEGNAPLPRYRILAIQEIIAGSYAEMSSDDVVVVDTHGTTISALDLDDDPLLRKQQETEAWFKQKIRSLLHDYPATVEVFAEIDPTMDVEKTVLEYADEGTTVGSKSRKIESTRNRQGVGGTPGVVANAIGNRPASLEDHVQSDKLSDKHDEIQKVAGQQHEYSRVASLPVKSISVSIGLPMSYYETIHSQEFLKMEPEKTAADVPPLTSEEYEKLKQDTEITIKTVVSGVLPDVPPGDDRTSLVEVVTTKPLPLPPPPEPDTAKIALTWLADSWQTIALCGLALLALLVARSAARSTGDTPPTEFQEGFGLELPAPPPEPAEEKDEDHMTITGGNLKDELVQIVEGNPEVAANVIRSWVGEAA